MLIELQWCVAPLLVNKGHLFNCTQVLQYWSTVVRLGCDLVLQEEKIAALQSFADQLIGADHYAKSDIFNRRNEVLDR